VQMERRDHWVGLHSLCFCQTLLTTSLPDRAIVFLLPSSICTTMSKITPALWFLQKRPTAHSFVAGTAVRRMHRSVPKIISIDTCKTILAVSTFAWKTSPATLMFKFSQAVRLQHLWSPLRYSTTTEQPLDDTFPRKEVQV
jgi:hypothetical protein